MRTKIERLVKADVLELARRQDREQAKTIVRIAACSREDLAPQRDGIGNLKVAKVQIALREAETIGPRRAQYPVFTQGGTQIVVIEKVFSSHNR